MNIKILNWNVNGIRAAVTKGFSEFINRETPDVVCLQEIKCNDLEVLAKIFNELNYSFQPSFAEKKGYSGTLVAWKTNSELELSLIDEISPRLGSTRKLAEIFKFEGRHVFFSIGDYILMNLYLPSGSSSEERQVVKYTFMENLYSFLSSLNETVLSKMIICGDFNICHNELDIHHPKEATKKMLSGFLPPEREWFSKLLKTGLTDTFRYFNPEKREYTWWSFRANSRNKNLGWRLDYFLVGNNVLKNVIKMKQFTEVLGSDHCPIEVVFKLN